MESFWENDTLVICLEGHIDSENAPETEAEIRSILDKYPGEYLLDAERLEYISSAGLRILLKLIRNNRPPKALRNASSEVYEILEMTGFTSLLNVKRKMRTIDLTGCPEIGHGAIGKVYRIDPDTIVKVYSEDVSFDSIETEEKRAKQAFLMGIPTAIAFEIVRAGSQYGSVFELVKAESCNDMIVRCPERFDEIIQAYVSLIKAVHSIEVKPGELPDCRDIYRDYLKQLDSVLPDEMNKRLTMLFDAMPDDQHAVHGDLHMKNVLFSDGEPILIDMETLSMGNPVFDFSGLFVTYKAYNENEPENTKTFLGIDRSTSDKIYEHVVRSYLDIDNNSLISEIENRIQILGYIRFLYLVHVLKIGTPELEAARIENSIERLSALLKLVDRLDIPADDLMS